MMFVLFIFCNIFFLLKIYVIFGKVFNFLGIKDYILRDEVIDFWKGVV